MSTGAAIRIHPADNVVIARRQLLGGTVIEGDWDAVMACVKACHEALHADGVPRVFTNLKMGTRTDKPQHMQDKITSVEALLAADP